MATELGYDQYLKHIEPMQGWIGGGDAGTYRDPDYRPMSEAEWNALSNEERYSMLVRLPTAADGGVQTDTKIKTGRFHNATIGDEEDASAFLAKFGAASWDPRQSGNAADEGGEGFLSGYGELPQVYGADPSEYMIDPSRVFRGEDGRWIIEADNIKGDWLAQQQAIADDKMKTSAMRALAIMAGAGLYGYMAGGIGTNLGNAALETGGIGYEVGSGGIGANLGGAASSAGGALHGGDLPYGSEISNTYTPGSNPLDYFGEPQWPGQLTGGDLPYGTEMPNVYDPGVDPTKFAPPPGGGPQLTGGDLPYGTEMPNTYAPGADPTAFAPPPGGLGNTFLDRLTNLDWGQIVRGLPGIASALGGGQTPGGGRPGGGGGGGGGGFSSLGGGGGGRGGPGGRPDSGVNPYGKPAKLTEVGALMQYLRGVNQ